MTYVRFGSITSKRVGANQKGRYICNHQTSFYHTTKYELLAPSYKGHHYTKPKTCAISS